MLRTVDIFCRVIDNFGDIGVCWRLARQLVREHGRTVTLWVDDLSRFRQICPPVHPGLAVQQQAGVHIRHWAEEMEPVLPAEVPDLVIEAFACDLPSSYVAAMAARPVPPVWINLEYLSAEAWVEDCHGLPSPHAGSALVKHFYFPGFSERTGGLFREGDLLARRDAFARLPQERQGFLSQMAVQPAPQESLVSLFCYPHAPLPALLAAMQQDERPTLCLVPEGVASATVSAWLGAPAEPGRQRRQGKLRLQVVPFLEQSDYDRLLWACDMNFVRGEDSLLRAQWAGRPFVWHIYPQEEGTHLLKLEAFLQRYLEGMPAPAAQALHALTAGWNGEEGAELPWRAVRSAWPLIAAHHAAWLERLQAHGDLATNLLRFAADAAGNFG